MAYAFRYLTPAEVADIGGKVTKAKTSDPVSESLLRAWEADLAAHLALVEVVADKDAHRAAIKSLEKALTDNAPPG